METLVERATRLGVETATVSEMLDEIERLRRLIADIKDWDVQRYMTIPHDLRARIETALTSKE